LRPDALQRILVQLADSIESDAGRLSKRRNYIQEQLIKGHLELLLGLLRTRSSLNQQARCLLSPGEPLTERFARIVDKITDKVCDYRIPISSRIRLTLAKPSALHNTPDLLYALRLYLTGDTGARAIQVTGVSEDDE
jgi:hypothetical protein